MDDLGAKLDRSIVEAPRLRQDTEERPVKGHPECLPRSQHPQEPIFDSATVEVLDNVENFGRMLPGYIGKRVT